jgi:hypothetical protein
VPANAVEPASMSRSADIFTFTLNFPIELLFMALLTSQTTRATTDSRRQPIMKPNSGRHDGQANARANVYTDLQRQSLSLTPYQCLFGICFSIRYVATGGALARRPLFDFVCRSSQYGSGKPLLSVWNKSLKLLRWFVPA